MQHNYDERYKYFQFTSFDNPMIDHKDLEERRRSLPDHVFKQEYLADFIDNASGLFKDVRDGIGDHQPKGKAYAGLDIGRADDYTVLTILNESGEMIYVNRWRHDDWHRIIDKVASIILQYKATTLIEVNNQGDVFHEMLRERCRNYIYPFTTTSKSKPPLIEDLAVAFEQHEIKIIGEQWLIDELENFTYIYNPTTRSVQYSAPVGLHDDGVISTALAWHSLKHYRVKGKYHILR